MEVFLDFLTDNYIYFLIAAGVFTLALIGLLVSGKKKGKEEPVAEVKNVEVTMPVEPIGTTEIRPEVTPQQVQTPITPVTPVINEIPNINPAPIPNIEPIQETPQQNESFSFGNNTPNMEPTYVAPQQSETLSFGNSVPNSVPNIQPNITPIQETPATMEPNNLNNTNVQTYDEPIMQINQTTDSNFHIDGNTNNNNM